MFVSQQRIGVTARLHSVGLKCLKDTCAPSCETEDACRQDCVLCLCEIMRTSASGHTLFAINAFFSCVKSLALAAFNHCEEEIMEWLRLRKLEHA